MNRIYVMLATAVISLTAWSQAIGDSVVDIQSVPTAQVATNQFPTQQLEPTPATTQSEPWWNVSMIVDATTLICW